MGRVRVKPVISTTTLTCVVTSGSSTITCAALFGSVGKGMRLAGAGIPFNSFVKAVNTTSSITIGDAQGNLVYATVTGAAVSVQFGYFTSAVYASGDALGFPFQVAMDVIQDVIVTDVAKQITKLKLYFFDAPFTQLADNAAASFAAVDASKVVGYISITGTNQVLANFHLMNYGTDFNLGGRDAPWCQAVVDTDTPTFVHVDDVGIMFIGESKE